MKYKTKSGGGGIDCRSTLKEKGNRAGKGEPAPSRRGEGKRRKEREGLLLVKARKEIKNFMRGPSPEEKGKFQRLKVKKGWRRKVLYCWEGRGGKGNPHGKEELCI